MSDGIHFPDANLPLDVPDWDNAAPTCAHASRPVREAHESASHPGKFLDWLPRLGPVLWLQRRGGEPDRHPMARSGSTVLLDHPAIGTLATCKALRAHHVITPQGPREWLSFHSGNDSVTAKLFLLPDSDVLAWDQMCSASQLVPGDPTRQELPTHATFLRRALARLGHRWQARLLEFRFQQEPWLSVLDAQPPLRLSLLGIDVVRNIVRDENAEWMSPLHML